MISRRLCLASIGNTLLRRPLQNHCKNSTSPQLKLLRLFSSIYDNGGQEDLKVKVREDIQSNQTKMYLSKLRHVKLYLVECDIPQLATALKDHLTLDLSEFNDANKRIAANAQMVDEDCLIDYDFNL